MLQISAPQQNEVWANWLLKPMTLCQWFGSWQELHQSIWRSDASTSRHLQQAIGGHEEPDSLIKASVTGGGVNPHIHKSVTVRRQKTVETCAVEMVPSQNTDTWLDRTGGGAVWRYVSDFCSACVQCVCMCKTIVQTSVPCPGVCT